MYRKFQKQTSKANIIQIVHNYFFTVFIILFKWQVFRWPNSAEQQVIATRFQLNFMFPHTVGVLDGTHIRLYSCPGFYKQKTFSLNAALGILQSSKQLPKLF